MTFGGSDTRTSSTPSSFIASIEFRTSALARKEKQKTAPKKIGRGFKYLNFT